MLIILLFLVFWWRVVIHWLTNEVTLVAGWCWVNRETSGGLTGVVVVYLM